VHDVPHVPDVDRPRRPGAVGARSTKDEDLERDHPECEDEERNPGPQETLFTNGPGPFASYDIAVKYPEMRKKRLMKNERFTVTIGGHIPN
jgi:hypothetical protein